MLVYKNHSSSLPQVAARYLPNKMNLLKAISFLRNIHLFFGGKNKFFLENQFPSKKFKLYLFNNHLGAIKLYLDAVPKSGDHKPSILVPQQTDSSLINQLRRSGAYDITYFYFDPVNFDEKAVISEINNNKSIKVVYLPSYLNHKYNLKKISKICADNEVFIINDYPHSFIENPPNQLAHANLYRLDAELPMPDGCLLVLQKALLSEALESHLDAEYEKLPAAGLMFYFWPLYRFFALIFGAQYSQWCQEETSQKGPELNRGEPIQKISTISKNYLNNLSDDFIAHHVQGRLDLVESVEGLLREVCESEINFVPNPSCFLAVDATGELHLLNRLDNLGIPYLTWPNNFEDSSPIKQPDGKLKEFILIPLKEVQPFVNAAHKLVRKSNGRNNRIRLEETTDKNLYEVVFKDISYSTLLQDWMYGEAKRREGWSPKRYIAYHDSSIIGLAQVLEKRKFGFKVVRVNSGPLAAGLLQRLQVISALKNKYSVFKASIFLMNPNVSLIPFGHVFLKSIRLIRRPSVNYHSSVIDLTAPIEQIRSNLDSKWRNLLKNSESKEVEIHRISSSAAVAEVLAEYDSYQSEKGFSGIPREILHSLVSSNLDNVIILSAVQAEGRVGTIVIYVHGISSTYLIGMSNSEGRKLNINYLLLWKGMEFLKHKGVQSFDLGGMDVINLPEITHFKQGLNGKEYRLCGEWL